jgi:hypothetical protein
LDIEYLYVKKRSELTDGIYEQTYELEHSPDGLANEPAVTDTNG